MQKKHVKGLKLVKARTTRNTFNELLSVVDVITCAKKYNAKLIVRYDIFYLLRSHNSNRPQIAKTKIIKAIQNNVSFDIVILSHAAYYT